MFESIDRDGGLNTEFPLPVRLVFGIGAQVWGPPDVLILFLCTFIHFKVFWKFVDENNRLCRWRRCSKNIFRRQNDVTWFATLLALHHLSSPATTGHLAFRRITRVRHTRLVQRRYGNVIVRIRFSARLRIARPFTVRARPRGQRDGSRYGVFRSRAASLWAPEERSAANEGGDPGRGQWRFSVPRKGPTSHDTSATTPHVTEAPFTRRHYGGAAKLVAQLVAIA